MVLLGGYFSYAVNKQNGGYATSNEHGENQGSLCSPLPPLGLPTDLCIVIWHHPGSSTEDFKASCRVLNWGFIRQLKSYSLGRV